MQPLRGRKLLRRSPPRVREYATLGFEMQPLRGKNAPAGLASLVPTTEGGDNIGERYSVLSPDYYIVIDMLISVLRNAASRATRSDSPTPRWRIVWIFWRQR